MIYLLRHHPVALLQHRARSVPRGGRDGPSKGGCEIAFDGNFRPHGWKGDLGRTRAVFMETLKRVDIALPTFDDEAVLWGDPSPESDRRADAGLRHRRDRGEERTVAARWSPPAARASTFRFRRWSSRSIRRGRRRLQCRLSGRAAVRRRAGRRGARGAPAGRPGDPPSRRDPAARRRCRALNRPRLNSFHAAIWCRTLDSALAPDAPPRHDPPGEWGSRTTAAGRGRGVTSQRTRKRGPGSVRHSIDRSRGGRHPTTGARGSVEVAPPQ